MIVVRSLVLGIVFLFLITRQCYPVTIEQLREDLRRDQEALRGLRVEFHLFRAGGGWNKKRSDVVKALNQLLASPTLPSLVSCVAELKEVNNEAAETLIDHMRFLTDGTKTIEESEYDLIADMGDSILHFDKPNRFAKIFLPQLFRRARFGLRDFRIVPNSDYLEKCDLVERRDEIILTCMRSGQPETVVLREDAMLKYFTSHFPDGSLQNEGWQSGEIKASGQPPLVFPRIVLRASYLPTTTELHSLTAILIQSVEVNPELAPSSFVVDIPAGVTIQDRRKVQRSQYGYTTSGTGKNPADYLRTAVQPDVSDETKVRGKWFIANLIAIALLLLAWLVVRSPLKGLFRGGLR